MALATQCPHCHTTFRVAHDQLKLRAGLVRCGACKQIFNGIENLLRPEEMEQAASWTIPAHPSRPASTPQEESRATDVSPSIPVEEAGINAGQEQEQDDSLEANTSHASSPAFDTTPVTEEETPKDDPLLRMTLMDFTHEQRGRANTDDAEPAPTNPDEPDPIEQAIEDLESKPWRGEQDATQADADALDQADAAGYEEPSFVRQGRRKQRIGRALRIVMSVGSVILLPTLLAQGTYVFRDQIAAWFPQTKPILAEACARIGCQVGLPAQIEAVSIESSELQTLAADASTYTLTVLLRNHGATEQAWPHIELTLNDANEKAIARRVFTPREYLPPPQDAKKGFAARSEQPVKLFFELAQLRASGYRVYLFYP